MSVLLAYDGMSSSDAALDYAIKYSIRFDEPLYILTFVRDDEPEAPESVCEYMQASQRVAASEGAVVHTMIESGRPDETILDVADRFDCSVVILGRPERSSLDRFFLGSVSDSVAKNARCTVILVPEGVGEE